MAKRRTCADCGATFKGKHPEFIGGRTHATCSYCGGLYAPGEPEWWRHCTSARHQIALMYAATTMARLLEQVEVIQPHYSALAGQDVVFDLARQP